MAEIKFKVVLNEGRTYHEYTAINKKTGIDKAFVTFKDKPFELYWINPNVFPERYERIYKTPEVGDKVTIVLHSDTHACKVTEVKNNKKIVVRHCKTLEWKDRDLDHEYSYGTPSETEFDGCESVFSYRAHGHWVEVGQKEELGSVVLSQNYWQEQYDNHF